MDVLKNFWCSCIYSKLMVFKCPLFILVAKFRLMFFTR